jgi:UTP--glucose-1-phosphate uridylyltransferase
MGSQRPGLPRVCVVGHRATGCQQPFSQCGLARGRHKVNDMVSTMSRSQISVPRTAIVPAAGLGTRFLPATKTVPKELLPVVDTPGIELVAAEAAEAGAERLVIITSEGKDGVVAHFVEDLVLEGTLEARGKVAMLAKVRRSTALIKVESVVQAEPLGLGHAISCVEPVLGADEDAVAVLLPDDLVLPTGVLETMSKVRAQYGGTVLCAIEVTPEEISAYGVFDVEPVPGADADVLKVNGMVEKPNQADAPSLYAAAGRYVLDRAIFDALQRIQRGVGGEMQLTDAIALLITEGHPVHVVVHRGSRHDLGNPGGYLKAAVDFALDRDDYGPELRRWLVTRLGLAER